MANEDFRPADIQRIDVTRYVEIRYWARELKCTPDQLREVVKAAGPSASSVRAYLAKNRSGKA